MQSQPGPRVFMGNATSQLINTPPGLVDLLRYDLAYEAPDASPDPTWDGWYRLMTETGVFPSGLVPHVRRLLAKYGVPVDVTDTRGQPPEQLPLHAAPHVKQPRPYQTTMVERAIQKGRGVIAAPPRSGKTFIGALIYDRNPVRTIWVAPTRGIVSQTVEALRELLPGVSVVGLMGGKQGAAKLRERAESRKADIVVVTAATAVKLGRDYYNNRDMLVVDEFHHAAASTYQEINRLAENVYYRFGMTGTHERSDSNTEILMHAVLSEIVGTVEVSYLIENGWLAPAHVYFVPIEGPRVYATDPDGAYRFGVAKHEVRNQWVTWAARTLASAGRRVIVLVKWVEEHGRHLAAAMPEATFVHGKTEVEPAIAAFNAGRIPILIGSSVLGEGRDLPAADGLVYAKAGKARVTVKQDIYRVLTAHGTKTEGVVVEFADRHNPNTLRHSCERGRIYGSFDDFSVEMLTPELAAGFAARVQV